MRSPWITSALLVLALSTNSPTKSFIGAPWGDCEVSRHALSPRSFFVKPSRTLTIDRGQMIAGIIRHDRRRTDRIRQQILASSKLLPFRPGVFLVSNIGDAYLGPHLASELFRVTELGGIALVQSIEALERRAWMIRAGWTSLGKGLDYTVYRKIKSSA